MTRAQNLHNDLTGEIPEIIVVYIGINDYRASVEVGNFEGVFGIYNSESGYIGDTSIFAEAYAIMVHKIKTAYPEAQIYLCNLPYYYETELLKSYNVQISAIADEFDCTLVDFYNDSDFTPDTLSSLTIDNLHPNELGMDTMTECIVEAIQNNSK